MIAVIDYGAGNLSSVVNAISYLGYRAEVTARPEDILEAGAVFLPGVGAARNAVANLRSLNLVEAIRRRVAEDRPLFGICLGLQLLLTDTEEDDYSECLDIIPGHVRQLPPGLKVPHMGWNQVTQKQRHAVFKGVPDEANFYFVHSYYAVPAESSVVAGETDYGVKFCSALARGNLVATQFHPEKSGEIGLKMYDNFIRMAGIQC